MFLTGRDVRSVVRPTLGVAMPCVVGTFAGEIRFAGSKKLNTNYARNFLYKTKNKQHQLSLLKAEYCIHIIIIIYLYNVQL